MVFVQVSFWSALSLQCYRIFSTLTWPEAEEVGTSFAFLLVVQHRAQTILDLGWVLDLATLDDGFDNDDVDDQTEMMVK